MSIDNNIIKSNIKGNYYLFKRLLIITTLFLLTLSTIATSNGHILIIGDSLNDLPIQRQEAIAIYQKLISDGYPVVFLLGDNATSENIIKGMYGADAIIYIGHGSDLAYYQNDNGTSKAPYALPTIDNVGIWTNQNFLSEGLNIFGFKYNGMFIPPFKKGASVMFIHTCFASGWVEDTFVANPDETIYKFNIPYVNSGANVYSSGYYQVYDGGYFDGVLGQELANGGEKSLTFWEANNLANPDDKIDISYYKEYNNMRYYSSNGGSLFIGNLDSYVLPTARECSEYDSQAADFWYDSGKPTDDPIYDESIKLSTPQNRLESFFDDFIYFIFNFIENFINILLNV
ncbi:MAG: hypothetical protein FWH29_08880 [Methanobrevibacter sp.]|nr:hypothetical protein [Methanobrevibacter sp.]